jgi:lipoyl(octanoyl) transferase
MNPRSLLVASLGTIPYGEALALQRAAARARATGDLADDLLILLEHPPVVTMGRSAKEKNLVASPQLLSMRGVELFEVERGGDVTFHGPGQLVGYPIIDLRQHRQDLHWYLRQLESVLVQALKLVGVEAGTRESLTGVWSGGRKIASIGIHARDWVTWHGFALNVTTDLSFFDFIVPCGINGVEMTSVAGERLRTGIEGDGSAIASEVRRAVVNQFAAAFDLRVTNMRADSLRGALAASVARGAPMPVGSDS